LTKLIPTDAAAKKFDKAAYQREYMVQWRLGVRRRKAKKEKDGK
jgi:hypothetical protein